MFSRTCTLRVASKVDKVHPAKGSIDPNARVSHSDAKIESYSTDIFSFVFKYNN